MDQEETVTTERWAAPESGIGRTVAIAFQLALLLALLYKLEIEPGTGLPRILPVVFVGFLIHAFLPRRHRLPFFLLLSFASAALVLGPLAAVFLVGIGSAIILLCHLPLPFSVRVTLVVLVGAGLALLRASGNTITSATGASAASPHLLAIVLPVLGSMFMFRLIIYMYDLKYDEKLSASNTGRSGASDTAGTSRWLRISYFFLFPNVAFLLFPVVDWRTFRRTYYDTEPARIYENGNWWIALGLAYFLAYRVVYHFLTPSLDEIGGVRAVASFMTSSYLVYLRVVGQFHIVIGMLCLFGFNLPPAHRYFLLSDSFTDFWRRTRIDWKDFMVKLVYYPSVVPLQRKAGKLPALVVSTILVFVATWFLHSYQWFWLKGDFPVSLTDVVFWGAVGSCVLVNSILEVRTRRKSVGKGWNLPGALSRSLRVVGIFLFFSVLWSYWSSPSFASWLSIVSTARLSSAGSYAKLAVILAGLVSAGVMLQWTMHVAGMKPNVSQRAGVKSGRQALIPFAWRAPLITSLGALVLIAERPGAQLSQENSLSKIANKLGTNGLNVADQTRLDRNYYDVLLDAPRATAGIGVSEVNTSSLTETAPLEITRMEFVRHTHDLLGYELKPSYSGIKYRGAPFQTNSLGMRDKEYSIVPAPGTYRIALLGASYEMASGVKMEEGFEWLLEERLNHDKPGNRIRNYEIMNFSVGGYEILQNAILAGRIFRFSPNAVIIAIKPIDSTRVIDHLVEDVIEGASIDEPYVRQKLVEVGAKPGDWRDVRRRIAPVSGDLVRWSLSHIAELCREHNVPAIALVVPRTSPRPGDDRIISDMTSWSESAGIHVLNLEGAFAGHPLDSVLLNRLDEHPSPLGHRLLANRLYDLLKETDGRVLSLGFRNPP